jgi:hypothetical protein
MPLCINNCTMKTHDDVLLEQAYNSIHESDVAGRSGAAASEYIRHQDQTPYTQDELGINTSTYKTQDVRFGSAEAQKQAVRDVLWNDNIQDRQKVIYNLIKDGKWTYEMFRYFVVQVSKHG